MGRHNDFYTKVGDGLNARTVGYGTTERDGYIGVRFVGPDGKRMEKMTACKKLNENFHVEAARIIALAFAANYPDLRKIGWDDALTEVENSVTDLRPATMTAYRKVVRVLKATLKSAPNSASEITSDHAKRFAANFMSGTYKRGKASDAKQYKRSPITLASHIRNLSAVWEHFLNLAIVRDNPWKTTRKPQVDKKRKPVPDEEDVQQFFAWVHARYPEWERLHALLDLKSLSACRTLDIVQLESNQLKGGRVVWTAAQTKQREGRSVLLPDGLYDTLKRVAGPAYLWEGFVEDLKQFRPSKNRLSESFDPMTVYWVLGNIFREYAEAHPDRPRLTPHALRRRAITLVTLATQSVDATAQAIGVNPATARGYYLDAQKAFDTDNVFRKTAAALIPKSAHTIPTLSGDSEAQSRTD